MLFVDHVHILGVFWGYSCRKFYQSIDVTSVTEDRKKCLKNIFDIRHCRWPLCRQSML